jgi:uroporphyrinogen-III synthase
VAGRVLILRPEPGASATAARARALGLEPLVSPLFRIVPLEWDAPDAGEFDALLLTSANAARHSGGGLDQFTSLPCYAVGEATAEAARGSGFEQVIAGAGDGRAAVGAMAKAGVKHALHLCGLDHIPLSHPKLSIDRRIVYAAEPSGPIRPGPGNALVLLHSPRAASRFAHMQASRGNIRIAAISAAAARAAGEGWAEVHIASAPNDQALLELAAKLCQTGADETRS